MQQKIKSIFIALLMLAVAIPMTQAGPSDTIVVTLTPGGTIDITVSPDTWDGEGASLGQTKSSATDAFKLDNSGNVQVNVTVEATDTAAWMLSTAPGHNLFQMQWGMEAASIADSCILRPTSLEHNFWGWTVFGTEEFYNAVNEETPDDTAAYVNATLTGPTGGSRDPYLAFLTTPSEISGTYIKNITLHARVSGGTGADSFVIAILINDFLQQSPLTGITSLFPEFEDYEYTFTSAGAPWSWDDLSTMELTIICSGATGSTVTCTQLYAVVNYEYKDRHFDTFKANEDVQSEWTVEGTTNHSEAIATADDEMDVYLDSTSGSSTLESLSLPINALDDRWWSGSGWQPEGSLLEYAVDSDSNYISADYDAGFPPPGLTPWINFYLGDHSSETGTIINVTLTASLYVSGNPVDLVFRSVQTDNDDGWAQDLGSISNSEVQYYSASFDTDPYHSPWTWEMIDTLGFSIETSPSDTGTLYVDHMYATVYYMATGEYVERSDKFAFPDSTQTGIINYVSFHARVKASAMGPSPTLKYSFMNTTDDDGYLYELTDIASYYTDYVIWVPQYADGSETRNWTWEDIDNFELLIQWTPSESDSMYVDYAYIEVCYDVPSVSWTNILTSPASFVSNLAWDQSQDFGLQVFMPTSSSTNANQVSTITFSATAN